MNSRATEGEPKDYLNNRRDAAGTPSLDNGSILRRIVLAANGLASQMACPLQELNMPPDRDTLMLMLERMWRIRLFEETVIEKHSAGQLQLPAHTYIGQEPVSLEP